MYTSYNREEDKHLLGSLANKAAWGAAGTVGGLGALVALRLTVNNLYDSNSFGIRDMANNGYLKNKIAKAKLGPYDPSNSADYRRLFNRHKPEAFTTVGTIKTAFESHLGFFKSAKNAWSGSLDAYIIKNFYGGGFKAQAFENSLARMKSKMNNPKFNKVVNLDMMQKSAQKKAIRAWEKEVTSKARFKTPFVGNLFAALNVKAELDRNFHPGAVVTAAISEGAALTLSGAGGVIGSTIGMIGGGAGRFIGGAIGAGIGGLIGYGLPAFGRMMRDKAKSMTMPDLGGTFRDSFESQTMRQRSLNVMRMSQFNMRSELGNEALRLNFGY